ncbi:MAG: CpaF family protein [Chloroflexi bacterium]|nr:CpaF family protein [Chloroflexota bacterium]
MYKPTMTRSEVELKLLNKVLARLYLDLVPVDDPEREEKLRRFDEVFGRKRPSAAEMRRLIQERDAAGEDLGSELQAIIPSELVILPQPLERARIQAAFESVLTASAIVLTRNEKRTIFETLVNDIMGFGPLEHAIHTDGVKEILVDRYNKIYIERHGKFEDLPHQFRDEEHLMEIIRRILTPLGKKVDETNPMVDARLPDGSRVNVVVPPIAIQGPSMVIRMFAGKPLTFEDLVGFGSFSQPIVDFLRACVEGRLNIVVSGGTASGKTTILNLITGLIPPDERVVTVENVVELRPSQTLKRIVRLESQAADPDGSGEVSVRDLVINAMRMRPDRLIIGEVRGSEAIDVFQALNTGYDGSMFSMHAKGIHDALSRLETMVYMAMPSLPLLQVRQQMAAAIDLILYQERLRDGTRKVLRVSEVVGMQGDAILAQDIFKFQETGVEDGRIVGQHIPTGYIPSFIKKIHAANVSVPMSLFTPQ